MTILVRLPPELDTPMFRKTWKTWVAYRTEIKRPLKSMMGVQLQLTRLARYGSDVASAMLLQSIENQWQGIFEVKRLMHPGVSSSVTSKSNKGLLHKTESLLRQELNLAASIEECSALLQDVKRFYKDMPGRETESSAVKGGLKYFFPSPFSLLTEYINFVASRKTKFKGPLRSTKPLQVYGPIWSWFIEELELRSSVCLRRQDDAGSTN